MTDDFSPNSSVTILVISLKYLSGNEWDIAQGLARARRPGGPAAAASVGLRAQKDEPPVIGRPETGGHRCMKKQPDELMARAREGHADALAEICEHYRNYLRVVVRSELKSRLRERVEFSDVVQEVLVEVVRQFPSFSGENEAALLGWMRRLVAQKLADLGRFHKRLKRGGGLSPVSLDRDLDLGNTRNVQEGGDVRLRDILELSQTSPSEAASLREQTRLLTGTLALLPASEAEVLWLHHAEGLSFSTISERLGLSRKRVRVIWARGLRSVRRSMGGQSI
jgi:RNA polymerase sigma-70 factor (ECF subfamily)